MGALWLAKLLAAAALAYLLILAAVFFAQTWLLFPAHLAGAAGPVPAGTVRIGFASAGGHRLEGLHVPPARPVTGERLLVLGFGGNAWNAGHLAAYLHDLYPEADVVAFHYRGYGPSGGRPGAAAFLEDAPRIHDFARETVGADRVVAAGFSVGAGVAARLGRERNLAGLILVTPFDSLGAVAAELYPWLPARWLLRHRMDAAVDLGRVTEPTAIIAGSRDTLVRPARTEALRAAARRLVYDRTIPGAGHNDIYDRPDFRQAMSDAMERIRAESPPA